MIAFFCGIALILLSLVILANGHTHLAVVLLVIAFAVFKLTNLCYKP